MKHLRRIRQVFGVSEAMDGPIVAEGKEAGDFTAFFEVMADFSAALEGLNELAKNSEQ